MTTTKTYRNRRTGDIVSVTADWAEASSPIWINYFGRAEEQTSLQVADARHRPMEGLRLAIAWLRTQYGVN